MDEGGEYTAEYTAACKEILVLLAAEGFAQHMHGGICLELADISHERSDSAEAMMWARRSLESFRLARGEGYTGTKHALRYCTDQTLPPCPNYIIK